MKYDVWFTASYEGSYCLTYDESEIESILDEYGFDAEKSTYIEAIYPTDTECSEKFGNII